MIPGQRPLPNTRPAKNSLSRLTQLLYCGLGIAQAARSGMGCDRVLRGSIVCSVVSLEGVLQCVRAVWRRPPPAGAWMIFARKPRFSHFINAATPKNLENSHAYPDFTSDTIALPIDSRYRGVLDPKLESTGRETTRIVAIPGQPPRTKGNGPTLRLKQPGCSGHEKYLKRIKAFSEHTNLWTLLSGE